MTNPITFEEPAQKDTEQMSTSERDKPPTGGPTKDEILAIALHKLEIKPGDIFADIGCGTGKVTLAVAPRVTMVHAMDIREEAFRWTEQEMMRYNLSNVHVYHDDAAVVLSTLQKLDTAFVGGSRNLREVIAELSRLEIRAVIIAAVLLETLTTAIDALRESDMFHEVIHVQISKSSPLAGGMMLRPLDPVYLIHGGRKRC